MMDAMVPSSQSNNNNEESSPSSVTTTTTETVPEPAEQKKIVKDIYVKKTLQKGETWYLISTKWWRSWKDYVGYDEYIFRYDERVSPGPIDNTGLVDENLNLRKDAMENSDFILVPEEIWNYLYQWFGGGPPLARKVIIKRPRSNSLQVEVNPFSLQLLRSSALDDSLNFYFSKADTVGHLKQTMCDKWGLDPEKVRVWDYQSGSKLKLLDNLDERIDAAQILDGQMVLIEEKKEDGTWPQNNTYPSSSSSSSSYNNSYYYGTSNYYDDSYSGYGASSSYGYSSYSRKTQPGLAGLNNLGNTCFMNSSLQCLSNTAPLAEFFISNNYLTDINPDNPLGMKGKLAEEFAKLIKELWGVARGMGGQPNSVVFPRDFKSRLERFAPQFSGYQQHDSHELLAFLLDGLHEDLNRIKKKPYVEMKENDGRPDLEVAKEAWELHKARNNSIVVDWFQAQLKSTLVCPDCNKISITFDPFMYLSLPLPIKTTRTIPITLIFRDPNRVPVKYGVKVNKMGNIPDLKKALSELCGLPPESLVLTDVYHSRFFKKFNDNESVDSIQERDVINAYEIQIIDNGENGDGHGYKNGGERSGDRYGSDSRYGGDSRYGSDRYGENRYGIEKEKVERNSWDIIHCPVYHRKDEIVNYGHFYYNNTTVRKSLFGVPMIISISPKMTYKQLYYYIVGVVKRCLKVEVAEEGEEVEEEEMEEEAESQPMEMDSENKKKADGEEKEKGAGSGYESDTDTEEEEEKVASSSKSGEKVEKVKKDRKSNRLFEILTIDSYGTGEKSLEDNDKPLELGDRQILALQWKDPDAVFDVDKNNEVVNHPTFKVEDERDEEDSIGLDKCLELFTATEVLGPEDPWYCNRCKDFRQATKKFDLWSLPPILVVHLKRFSYKNKYWREKLETVVRFPLKDLDLRPHLIGPCDDVKPPMYDLYAVSNHYGSMGGGHYTAYALNKYSNKWYKFDDSYVTEIEESQVVTSAAYVLFYRRKDTVKPPPPLPDPDSDPEPPQPSSSSSSLNNYNNYHSYHQQTHQHHHNSDDDEPEPQQNVTSVTSISHRTITTIPITQSSSNHVSRDHMVPSRFPRFSSSHDTDDEDDDEDDDDSDEFDTGIGVEMNVHGGNIEQEREYISANSSDPDVTDVDVGGVVGGGENGGGGGRSGERDVEMNRNDDDN